MSQGMCLNSLLFCYFTLDSHLSLSRSLRAPQLMHFHQFHPHSQSCKTLPLQPSNKEKKCTMYLHIINKDTLKHIKTKQIQRSSSQSQKQKKSKVQGLGVFLHYETQWLFYCVLIPKSKMWLLRQVMSKTQKQNNKTRKPSIKTQKKNQEEMCITFRVTSLFIN